MRFEPPMAAPSRDGLVLKPSALNVPALALGMVLMAGCTALESAVQQSSPRAPPAEAPVAIEPQAAAAAAPAEPPRPLPAVVKPVAAAPIARTAQAARPGPLAASAAKPAAPAPTKVATSPPPVAQPAVKGAAAPPPLDLKSLETQLRGTKAIGVFAKLALKNQIDDLLDQFRAFYQGVVKTSLADLRRSFDLLVMKTLALLQDGDPPLAGALASSRESIWGILSDRAKFATV
jgi:hypothetical protein